jgi:hypothetical protein
VPNLFELSVLGTCEGADFVNTFYYADGGAALVPLTESNLSGGWIAAFMAHYRACLSADANVTFVKVQCLTSPTRIPFVQPSLLAGTGPAGHEPMTVCATMARKSGIKGQAGRGRISLPAVPTAWVTASQITTAAAYNTLGTDMANTFTAAGVTYSPQIVSRKNRAGPVLGASLLLNATLDSVVGSARRRKINR